MASIYKEGTCLSARIRSTKNNAFKSGFRTKADAEAWVQERTHAQNKQGKALGLGPDRTLLGQALFDYVQKKLPFKKGSTQDLSRANKYLRACQLDTFKAIPLTNITTDADKVSHVRYFDLKKVTYTASRKIPKGLGEHRQNQAKKSAVSDEIRDSIARTMVADIQPYHLQSLFDQLQTEGYAPATIHLERAFLREFFNYARRTWRWPQPATNPASDVRMPKVNNHRSRVLSTEEQQRLEQALESCKNPYIAPAVALLIETTMRQSELIVTARWKDFNAAANTLHLRTAKAGGRTVPLTDEAVNILQSLTRGQEEDPIFPISLEALKGAWNDAVKRAGIENLKLHDLRHTGATRLSIRLNGNIFLLQLATGHNTLSQLQRYVNLTAADAVNAFKSTANSIQQAQTETQATDTAIILSSTSNIISFADARQRKKA